MRLVVLTSKKLWFGLWLLTTVALIFLIISYKSKIARLSFKKQRLNKEYALKHKQKEALEQEIITYYNNETIYQQAQATLGMEKIHLMQVRSLE